MRNEPMALHESPQPLPEMAKVLILDDQRFDRHRLARLCSGLDMKCTITNAKTLAEFASVIDASKFELVIIDYCLPDGTGFDALAMVRLSPANLNAATIMVSGQGQEGVAQDALKAGCSDYITKDDLSVTSFRRAVTNALQKSVLTQSVQTQTVRSAGTQAVLEQFSLKCAQDIKPMVSRMMRQLRDLRASGVAPQDDDKNQLEGVEDSCMLLWEFLVDLESYQPGDGKTDEVPAVKVRSPISKPPSPFARLSG